MNKMCRLFLAACCILAISGCATQVDVYPRYDGLYYKQFEGFTMYFLFFNEYRVINANTDGRRDISIMNWFNRNFTENQGTYSIDGKRINFYVESEQGRVEFNGTVTRHKRGRPGGEKMKLRMNSLINGKKMQIYLKFLPDEVKR